MGENWGFLGFFSDFGGTSLLLGQKWGLVCQYAGHGWYRQEKTVEKLGNIGINFNKFGKIQLFWQKFIKIHTFFKLTFC